MVALSSQDDGRCNFGSHRSRRATNRRHCPQGIRRRNMQQPRKSMPVHPKVLRSPPGLQVRRECSLITPAPPVTARGRPRPRRPATVQTHTPPGQTFPRSFGANRTAPLRAGMRRTGRCGPHPQDHPPLQGGRFEPPRDRDGGTGQPSPESRAAGPSLLPRHDTRPGMRRASVDHKSFG